MKLKYLFTTLLAGAMFMSGCTEVSLENPLEEDEPTFFTRIVRKEADGSLTSVFEAETEWTRR